MLALGDAGAYDEDAPPVSARPLLNHCVLLEFRGLRFPEERGTPIGAFTTELHAIADWLKKCGATIGHYKLPLLLVRVRQLDALHFYSFHHC